MGSIFINIGPNTSRKVEGAEAITHLLMRLVDVDHFPGPASVMEALGERGFGTLWMMTDCVQQIGLRSFLITSEDCVYRVTVEKVTEEDLEQARLI